MEIYKYFIFKASPLEYLRASLNLNFAILATYQIRVNSCAFVVSKIEPKPTAVFRIIYANPLQPDISLYTSLGQMKDTTIPVRSVDEPRFGSPSMRSFLNR